MALTTMTFYQRFENDILSGKKTITIRDSSEKDFLPNSLVSVATYETGRYFCTLRIKRVVPTTLDQLSQQHAEQENMTLAELKRVITDIYPGEQQFYVIYYELVS
ncbi:N(4)-acetylcytidine aminohydrolase [Thalassotalea ponticola]|uniref:N(4)-acetylcytidine aminohydrolase n=1 Tax=Thalassotalea ponticola TaxID=1523392 RepID=UPI0025B58EA2|nr:N(4)-acetylcytidine aminohydrolase [Thalassotalea ponticola]MDN3653937.1 N(4)-acetylcytidine aminohydrolase [Thalassotalea ponticola]